MSPAELQAAPEWELDPKTEAEILKTVESKAAFEARFKGRAEPTPLNTERPGEAASRCPTCGGKPWSPRSIWAVKGQRPSRLTGKALPSHLAEHICPNTIHAPKKATE